MAADTTQKRILRVCAVGGLLAAALGSYALLYNVTGHGIPCLLYRLTGLQCAGCGLTRALAAVSRLAFREAFTYHALWPVYALYFSWILLSNALAYIRRGELQLLPGRWWVHIPVAALLVGYGFLRNVW